MGADACAAGRGGELSVGWVQTHRHEAYLREEWWVGTHPTARCTTPVREGEDPRAGRWCDSGKEECGIHFDGEKWVQGPLSGESFDSP